MQDRKKRAKNPRPQLVHAGPSQWWVLIGGLALLLAIAMLLMALPRNGAQSYPITIAQVAEADIVKRLRLPKGFSINRYATGLGRARLMAMTPKGDIVLSSPSSRVLLVKADRNGDGRADDVVTLMSGLDNVHGLWLDSEWLYVAESTRVFRIRFNAEHGTASGAQEVMVESMPDGGGHWTRTIRQGPDGFFYVSIGSSCNVCIEEHPWRAAIIRFKAGEKASLYADGLRNTVGFDWQPGTNDLYGVDNGRDRIGDDLPPEEMNKIVEGGFYGWPFRYGDNVPDPQFGKHEDPRVAKALPPAHSFEAHTAPLSIPFLRHLKAPGYENAALVAQHGSWNRSSKIGYRVVSVHWDASGRISNKVFLDGFEVSDNVVGRPVDVLEAPDGTLYVSDDFGQAIWRVVYKP